MSFQSTKTFGHELGLSACFRQWKSDSHCRHLHGYALSISFLFEASKLDERNWVVDFGSFKRLKQTLIDTFDHKLIVAEDDPHLDELSQLQGLGLASVVVLPRVGCEAFAHHIYNRGAVWMYDEGLSPRVRLVSVEVREHGANSAIYKGL